MAVTAVKSSMLIMHLSAAITGRKVIPRGMPKHLQKDVYKYPHPRTLFFQKKRSLPLPLGTPSNDIYFLTIVAFRWSLKPGHAWMFFPSASNTSSFAFRPFCIRCIIFPFFFLEAQSSSSRKKTLREEFCAIFKIARSYKSRVDPATQTRKSGSFRNHPQLPITSGGLIMKFRVNPSFSGFMT